MLSRVRAGDAVIRRTSSDDDNDASSPSCGTNTAHVTPPENTASPLQVTERTGSETDLTGSFSNVRRTWTIAQMLALFACSFSYAFIFNTVNNVVIPREIERLAPSKQSIWVGLIMGAGALSQLATPVVGAASDRTGTRTPFLTYGSFVVVMGLALFLATAAINDLWLLFVAHVMTSLGLSMQYAMVSALLNDHVVEEQVGQGSGTMAILAIVGSGAGYVMFAVNLPSHYCFLSYMGATVVCLLLTLSVVPAQDPVLSVKRRHLSNSSRPWGDCGHALSVPSPTKYPDFFYACLSRALFNAGLAGQVYLVYYFRDVLHAENPTQLTSLVAVMALIGGVIGALPAGVLSDRLGKKPLIYWSIAVCVLSLVCFLLGVSVGALQLIGLVYGIGNVSYLSVDYALGVQSLPRKPSGDRRGVPIDAAKDLGVFAMSATVGQLCGQVLYAGILEQFSLVSPTGFVQYSYLGFVSVFGLGCVAFVLSGVATSFVKSVNVNNTADSPFGPHDGDPITTHLQASTVAFVVSPDTTMAVKLNTLSASGSHDVGMKRLRRTAEPQFKSCSDDALDCPWTDLNLSHQVNFALSNVCHFSHATAIQAQVIPRFVVPGCSVAVEAATGSGKTLAFIVPLMERLVKHAESHYRSSGAPLRSRRIVGAILSPNRVLAQQTFIVARTVASRATQFIRFVLCDVSLQPASAIGVQLRQANRVTGIVLVGTPADVLCVRCDIEGSGVADGAVASPDDVDADGVDRTQDWKELAVLANTADKDLRDEHHDKDGDSDGLDSEELAELRRARRRKAARRSATQQGEESTQYHQDDVVSIGPNPNGTFTLVIDEADVVLKSEKMLNATRSLIRGLPTGVLDIGLFGATLSSSQSVDQFVAELSLPEPLHRSSLASNEQYVSKLNNRYVCCAAADILQTLVHMINAHPSKKYFVFFNSVVTLRHVREVLRCLMGGRRPLLHIGKLFALHEGMKDAAKNAEFRRFVCYNGVDAEAEERADLAQSLTVKAQRKLAANAQAREQDLRRKTLEGFANGTRRSASNLTKARGAVLLCTDVSAFGLDVRDVEYVIHFEAPSTVRSYIHRLGRVARMGMRGISTILLPRLKHDPERDQRLTQYLEHLSDACRIEQASMGLGNLAPIASNIRAVVQDNNELLETAQQAALAMVAEPDSWFDAHTAMQALTAGL